MTSTIDDRLVDLEGTYFDILSRINPETIQHSNQLVTAHVRGRHMICGESYWPGDFVMYVLEGDDIVMYIARLPANPWVNNPVDSLTRLKSGKYPVYIDQIENIRSHRQTTRVDMGKVFGTNISVYSSIPVEKDIFELSLSEDQSVFLERFLGNRSDSIEYCKGLREQGARSLVIGFALKDSLRRLITEDEGIGFVPFLKWEPPHLRIIIDPLESGPYFGGYMRAVPIRT